MRFFFLIAAVFLPRSNSLLAQDSLRVSRSITEVKEGYQIDLHWYATGSMGMCKWTEQISTGTPSVHLSAPDVAAATTDHGVYWIFANLEGHKEASYLLRIQKKDSLFQLHGEWQCELTTNRQVFATDTSWKRRVEPEKHVLVQETPVKKDSAVVAVLPEKKEAVTQENSCVYRVQISASVNRQQVAGLSARINGNPEVREERIDQWFKYTTGCFADKSEALRYMHELEKQGFKKPFAVRYRNGKRE